MYLSLYLFSLFFSFYPLSTKPGPLYFLVSLSQASLSGWEAKHGVKGFRQFFLITVGSSREGRKGNELYPGRCLGRDGVVITGSEESCYLPWKPRQTSVSISMSLVRHGTRDRPARTMSASQYNWKEERVSGLMGLPATLVRPEELAATMGRKKTYNGSECICCQPTGMREHIQIELDLD